MLLLLLFPPANVITQLNIAIYPSSLGHVERDSEKCNEPIIAIEVDEASSSQKKKQSWRTLKSF